MKARVCDLGRMSYKDALDVQLAAHQMVKEGGEEVLLLVEHAPVLTLGASFNAENLLFPRRFYEEQGVEVVETDRGGDVTYHGPGQLTIYPIFDLSRRDKDVHGWLRRLEETQIQTLKAFGLGGYRFPPHTGVWCNGVKVAAIGVKVRRWVSLHGVALNCDISLEPFRWIVPCGIHDHGVGSISQLARRRIGVADAKPSVIQAFATVFAMELEPITLKEILP